MSILKANGKIFKTVKAASRYVKSLEHGVKRFSTQISIIEFFNETQEKDSDSRARLAQQFRDDESWRACGWTVDQFDDLIEPIMTCRQVFTVARDRRSAAINTISRNWSAEIAEAVGSEKGGQTCLRRIASVLTSYKDRYMDARTLVNYIIIERILSKKNKQSGRRVASLIDWTTLFNSAVSSESPPPISEVLLEKARVRIGDFGILRAGPYKTIESEKKVDLQLDSDSPEGDQALSASENTDNSADFKDSKKNTHAI